MNISYRWLRSLAPGLEDTPREVADRLAMYGAPVDEVVDIGGPLAEVLVARVAEVARHPNADRLWLCRVDAGGGELLPVVCGAPVVNAGSFYPFIPEGGTLPGGVVIRRAKIRGQESRGMLCSARELGLGRDHEGILELHGTFTPGERFIDAVELEDVRLVVDVTPNRPDLLSHFGIARELAPGGESSLKLPRFPGGPPAVDLRFDERPDEVHACGVSVAVEDPEACPHYTATVMRGVRVGPSPEWLASRLRAVGQRPINNVVDATNYVLQELGQPLHAFDLDALGERVVIRRARAGERLTTLDGEARALSEGMLVIADANRPVALAGVMGGRDTEVGEATRDVLLEGAIFDPGAVRRTRRGLGMMTDASQRFERGVDPDGLERAVRRAVELIVAVAGGEPCVPAASVRAREPASRDIELSAARLRQVLGVELSPDAAARYLEELGFSIVSLGEGTVGVRVPGHRRYDVFREDDLVEEVARRHGYDAFPDDLRPYRPSAVPDDAQAALEGRLRDLLAASGLLEARSAGFAPEAEGDVALLNPLSTAESRLRRSLLDGLAHRVEANFNRGVRDVRLYEIGTVFAPGEPGGRPREATHIAAVLTGARSPAHWSAGTQPVDLFDLKGVVSVVAGELGLQVETGSAHAPGAHMIDPALAFRIQRPGGPDVGAGGPLLGSTIDAPAWAGAVFGFELALTDLRVAGAREFSPLPAFPAIERDLALLLPVRLPADRVRDTLLQAGGVLLEAVEPFDVYAGPGIPPGTRSVAYRLRFRAPDRTLTDREVDGVIETMLKRLREEHGVERRG